MFSKAYRPSIPSFGSNWFQFQPADIVSRELRQIGIALIDSPVPILCVPFDVFIDGFGSSGKGRAQPTAVLLQAVPKRICPRWLKEIADVLKCSATAALVRLAPLGCLLRGSDVVGLMSRRDHGAMD
jgi:hypothetical protein